MSEEIDSSMCMIEVADGCVMTFVHIPKGYSPSSFTLENADSAPIGWLKSFNRIKKIAGWKDNPKTNLVNIFTGILKQEHWDFARFPNPYAFLSKIKSEK